MSKIITLEYRKGIPVKDGFYDLVIHDFANKEYRIPILLAIRKGEIVLDIPNKKFSRRMTIEFCSTAEDEKFPTGIPRNIKDWFFEPNDELDDRWAKGIRDTINKYYRSGV